MSCLSCPWHLSLSFLVTMLHHCNRAGDHGLKLLKQWAKMNLSSCEKISSGVLSWVEDGVAWMSPPLSPRSSPVGAESLVNSFFEVAYDQVHTIHTLCLPWLVPSASAVSPLWSRLLGSSLQLEEEQEGGAKRSCRYCSLLKRGPGTLTHVPRETRENTWATAKEGTLSTLEAGRGQSSVCTHLHTCRATATGLHTAAMREPSLRAALYLPHLLTKLISWQETCL